MASTLCPACGERVEHEPNWLVTVSGPAESDGRTRMIANGAIVIHVCTGDDGGVAREPPTESGS